MTQASLYLVQQLINGLVLGSLYALVAIGFSMIYSVLRLVNFAHGDVMTIGAFAGLAALAALSWPFAGAAAAVLACGLAVGVLVELVAFRPIRRAPQVTGFITSLAVSIFMQNLGILTLTAQPRTFRLPAELAGVEQVAGVFVRRVDLVVILLTAALLVALNLWVQRTRTGMAIRAVAENPRVAAAVGIDTDRVIRTVFAVGSALAALAGVMWAGRSGQVSPLMGVVPGLKAFVAAVMGGVGSLSGAVAGGYLLGMAEVAFVGLLPPAYSSYRDAFVFGLFMLLLVVRPAGLLGQAEEGV